MLKRLFVVVAVLFCLSLSKSVNAQTFSDICPLAFDKGVDVSSIFPQDTSAHSMKKDWQRQYPMLIVDSNAETAYWVMKETAKKAAIAEADSKVAATAKAQALADFTAAQKAFNSLPYKSIFYWKEAGDDKTKSALLAIRTSSIVATTYTTEKVLVLVCSAVIGDGSTVAGTVIHVNDSAANSRLMKLTLPKIPPVKQADLEVNRLYALDAAADNDLIRVAFTRKLPSSDDPKVTGDNPEEISVLLERHKIIYFSAGGGLLLTRATQTNYAASSVAAQLTTTTAVTQTTTTDGTQTGTESDTTTATSAATVNYVFSSPGNTWQVNSVAGLTWYPLGNDTFPVSGRHGFAWTYGHHSFKDSIGLFVGTSANTLGYFTVGPAYEVVPGIQVLAASSWWSKSTLRPNISPCTGYGASPSFNSPPNSTESNTTSTTTGTPPSTTVVTTTTTISSTTVSGCINGDKATMLPGTTVPTDTNWKAAFSFGIIFNTNLLKAFTSFGK